MTPKEMGDLHGILSRGFFKSYWERKENDAFERSRLEFLEKMAILGGKIGNNDDLEPDERNALLCRGWVDDKIHVAVGRYVRFPEETMRKILVLGLP